MGAWGGEPPDQYLSPDQHVGLQRELEDVHARKAELGRQIAETSDMFSGESEGNALRDEFRFLMHREDQISALLRLPVVRDQDLRAMRGGDGTIRLGATVIVEIDGSREQYTIVPAVQASPADGRISNQSPVGLALLGRKAGDAAVVPGLGLTIRILHIED